LPIRRQKREEKKNVFKAEQEKPFVIVKKEEIPAVETRGKSNDPPRGPSILGRRGKEAASPQRGD